MNTMANPESTSDEQHDGTEKPALTEDEIYHLLQVERRRAALRYLRDRDGPVEMRDLAEQVAAWEHDITVDALASRQRQRVYIPLYQRHLPKLDEAGVIDYNQPRGIVERTDRADRLDPYLVDPDADDATTDDANDDDRPDRDEHADDRASIVDVDEIGGDVGSEEEAAAAEGQTVPWNRYYLATSGLALVVLSGAALELPGLATLSGLAVGTLVFAMFCVLTVVRVVNVARGRLFA